MKTVSLRLERVGYGAMVLIFLLVSIPDLQVSIPKWLWWVLLVVTAAWTVLGVIAEFYVHCSGKSEHKQEE